MKPLLSFLASQLLTLCLSFKPFGYLTNHKWFRRIEHCRKWDILLGGSIFSEISAPETLVFLIAPNVKSSVPRFMSLLKSSHILWRLPTPPPHPNLCPLFHLQIGKFSQGKRDGECRTHVSVALWCIQIGLSPSTLLCFSLGPFERCSSVFESCHLS